MDAILQSIGHSDSTLQQTTTCSVQGILPARIGILCIWACDVCLGHNISSAKLHQWYTPNLSAALAAADFHMSRQSLG